MVALKRLRRRKKITRLNHAMKVKMIGMIAFIAILFSILIGRLVYFGVFKNGIYEKQVLSQQNYSSTTIPYKRGDILDRNGNTLATSKKLYNLVLEPKNILEREKTKKKVVGALVKYMGVDEQDLLSYLKKNKNSYYSVYKEDLTYNQVSEMKEYMEGDKGDDIVGVVFSEKYERQYPNNSLASQVVGFLSDNKGSGGIEQYYNSELSGVDGRKYTYLDEELEQDSSIVEPENGETIVSTIDSNIQELAQKQIDKFEKDYGSKGSSILVMNPNNGEIYAMASSTSFDLNDPRNEKNLLKKFKQSEIEKMDQKEMVEKFNEIWKNPMVSNSFEPGSTYKPFTVAAGLEEGILNGNESFNCNGYEQYGSTRIHCSHRNGHGVITLSEVISLSCNDATMQIAQKEGKDVFTKYQKEFNFGSKTGIDLPGEADTSGLLHGADTMKDVDLATSSFGQSFNCSMIQMASSFSSLVNGGNYYQPHVVRQLQDDKGNVVRNVEPTLVKQTISKDTSDKLRKYMQETVESGTGKRGKLDDYTVGGKTGTAEKLPRGRGNYIVSFCGFAPVENPQVVVYVVADEIQEGSQQNTGVVVEMARNVLEGSLKELKVAKSSKK